MEHRYTATPPAVRQASGGAGLSIGKCVGLAAVFGDGTDKTRYLILADAQGAVYEEIDAAAFDADLARGGDVVSYYNHSADHLLGRRSAGTLKLWKGRGGLGYEVSLPDTTAGRDVAVSVRRGDVRGASISFLVRAETWLELANGDVLRRLTDVALIEAGPVANPAYTATTADFVGLTPDDSAPYQPGRSTRRLTPALRRTYARMRAHLDKREAESRPPLLPWQVDNMRRRLRLAELECA